MADIITDFVEATRAEPIPEVYRLWAAIGMVSTVLSRRCWTSILPPRPIWGNIWAMLVGRPTTGKSLAIDLVVPILRAVSERAEGVSDSIVVAPDWTSPEYLIKHLGLTFPDTPGDMKKDGLRSYGIIISEVGTFMQKPDLGFMQSLARLWDCPDEFTKGAKHAGVDRLFYPYVTFLVGAQPEWVNALLHQDIMEMGLPSRLLFIYAPEGETKEPFTGTGKVMYGALEKIADRLERVHDVTGYVPFDKEAQARFRLWYKAGYPGAPEVGADGPLHAYVGRRHLHAAKLALVKAMATHPDDTVIRLPDLEWAREVLFQAEPGMVTVLGFAGGNPFKLREAQAMEFVREAYKRGGRPLTEAAVRSRLSRDIPTPQVGSVLDALVARGELVCIGEFPAPRRMFKPRPQ